MQWHEYRSWDLLLVSNLFSESSETDRVRAESETESGEKQASFFIEGLRSWGNGTSRPLEKIWSA